jgi:GNAT superfamily N-acetyltransferase
MKEGHALFALADNKLGTEDYLRLREAVGWLRLPYQQAEAGLRHSLFTVAAISDHQVVGMGRLVGDGVTICYVQDVIVLPEYQGKGIGGAILDRLITHVKERGMPDTYIKIGLFSAKGKEGFYEGFGFGVRPNENRGPGMEMAVRIYPITKP